VRFDSKHCCSTQGVLQRLSCQAAQLSLAMPPATPLSHHPAALLLQFPFLAPLIPRQRKALAAVDLIRQTTNDLIKKCKEMVDDEEMAAAASAAGGEYLNEGVCRGMGVSVEEGVLDYVPGCASACVPSQIRGVNRTPRYAMPAPAPSSHQHT
jgi:hypothetical protein